jgi:hypothetical protein
MTRWVLLTLNDTVAVVAVDVPLGAEEIATNGRIAEWRTCATERREARGCTRRAFAACTRRAFGFGAAMLRAT